MSLKVSFELMIIMSWVCIKIPIRWMWRLSIKLPRVRFYGQVAQVSFSGNDLLADSISNLGPLGDLVHDVGAVLIEALWVSCLPDGSAKLRALVYGTEDLVKSCQVLKSEWLVSTVVMVLKVVGSALNSVSILSVIDVSGHILDVWSVQGIVVDLVVFLLGVDIFGVAVEVDKCVHFKDLLLINLL